MGTAYFEKGHGPLDPSPAAAESAASEVKGAGEDGVKADEKADETAE